MTERATAPDVRAVELRLGMFRALGDPTRLALIVRLAAAAEPQTVTELTSCCGVHLSGVSRHLASLRDAGLLLAERRGREVRYRLERAALTATLRGLADAIDACAAGRCAPRIDEGEPDGRRTRSAGRRQPKAGPRAAASKKAKTESKTKTKTRERQR